MIIPSERIPPADAEKAVSERYIEALNLNNKIIVSAQLAQQNLYDMCMGFKKMRDDKLYKELGYSDFGDYCENETGFKRRQVYNYIAVAEKLPSDFVHSSAQIGVKKMTLLSTLSEEERTEITANTDLENTTVKELEQQIKELKDQQSKSREAFDRVADQSKENYQKYLDEMHKREDLACECGKLEQKCKELESRPVEIATQVVEKIPDEYVTIDAYEKMVNTYVAQLAEADEEFVAERRRAYAEKEELERKIAELENAQYEDNGEEIFTLLCQVCRHPLSRLAMFVSDNPLFRRRFEEFVAENAVIIEED